MEFLVNSGNVQNTPESIVQFLMEQKNIKKVAVGQYLGNGQEISVESSLNFQRDSFNSEVLRFYLERLDFLNLPFDEALR